MDVLIDFIINSDIMHSVFVFRNATGECRGLPGSGTGVGAPPTSAQLESGTAVARTNHSAAKGITDT